MNFRSSDYLRVLHRNSIVISFIVAEGVGVRHVHRRMEAVYRKHALSLTGVQDCLVCFCEGRESVNTRPGQDQLVITPSHHHLIVTSFVC